MKLTGDRCEFCVCAECGAVRGVEVGAKCPLREMNAVCSISNMGHVRERVVDLFMATLGDIGNPEVVVVNLFERQEPIRSHTNPCSKRRKSTLFLTAY